MGLLVWVLFETYMRPSESFALGPDQVIPPAPGGTGAAKWSTILVHAEELKVSSKVSEYDDSVPLDLERQQFLVEPLLLLKASRLDQQLLWPFKYSEFQKKFAAVVKELALTKFGLLAIGLRHGGASHDRSVLANELVAVQQRGACRSFSSARR